MGKFRKKPVVIEAFRWSVSPDEKDSIIYIEDIPIWFGKAMEAGMVTACSPQEGVVPEIDITTLEGKMHVSLGDWIIQGVNGEIYPCKPDIFQKTYEPVLKGDEVW